MKLVIEDIRKAFDTNEVLKGATYTFEQGRIYGLLGRNGAGKTTLFNCLNEDLRIDSGAFWLEDEAGNKRPISSDDIGYVLSTPVVPEFLTAREFLRFFLDVNKGKIPYPQEPEVYLDYMQIDPESRDRLLKDYSHGMKNKMQLLIQYIANPPVMLLDEPLTSLDVVASEEMKDLFKRRKAEHITILSTHIMELALDLCDDIVILHNGVLAPVDREQLDDDDYKAKIIAALREEDDA